MSVHTEAELLHYLDAQSIPYQRIEHPPVYTCEQAERYRPSVPGLPAVSTKNLFLAQKKGRSYYLVMTACEKRLDLKRLGDSLRVKLHFGSEQKLLELLGVTPGAVTVLGLINDTQAQVELLVDAEIWPGGFFLCHPLVNTATLVLAKADLQRFFDLTQHTIRLVEM